MNNERAIYEKPKHIGINDEHALNIKNKRWPILTKLIFVQKWGGGRRSSNSLAKDCRCWGCQKTKLLFHLQNDATNGPSEQTFFGGFQEMRQDGKTKREAAGQFNLETK
jgi:hypothetical protein